MSDLPLVTAVLPVWNDRDTLARSLESLRASDYPRLEIVVVDNASTDGSYELATRLAAAAGGVASPPARVVRSERNLWCGGGKNLGASLARGEYIFFTDSDVVVAPDTVGRLAARLAGSPGLAAVFGSYTLGTEPGGFFSRYKNLVHHYTHQTTPQRAVTFWGGCGMVRRADFERLGGFRAGLRFVSDIEFGYRLRAAGGEVWLDREVQVTHLKRYTLRSLLRSDIRARAIPWTRVLLDRRMVERHMNLRWQNLASGAASWLAAIAALGAAAAALAAPAGPEWARRAPLALIGLALLLFTLYLVANRELFTLARREGGAGFALGVAGFHYVYYLYATAGFACGAASYLARRARRATAAELGAAA